VFNVVVEELVVPSTYSYATRTMTEKHRTSTAEMTRARNRFHFRDYVSPGTVFGLRRQYFIIVIYLSVTVDDINYGPDSFVSRSNIYALRSPPPPSRPTTTTTTTTRFLRNDRRLRHGRAKLGTGPVVVD